MTNNTTDDVPLGQGSYTLADLAGLLAPRAYDYWSLVSEQLTRPVLDRDQLISKSLIDWVPGSPIRLNTGLGPHRYVDLSAARRRALEGRREALFRRISSRIRDAVASTRCVTVGIGPAGTLIEVPRVLAAQVVIDLEGNTLGTLDGHTVWRAVTVRAIAEAELSSLSNPASPNAFDGDTPPDDRVVTAWLVEEQAKRIKADRADKGYGLKEVRIYLRHEFPHLSRDDVDHFYRSLPANLQEKSGPKGPWKNKPKSL